jgi:hypothetical protein
MNAGIVGLAPGCKAFNTFYMAMLILVTFDCVYNNELNVSKKLKASSSTFLDCRIGGTVRPVE